MAIFKILGGLSKILRISIWLDLTVGTAKEQPLPTLQKHAQCVPTILKMAKVQLIMRGFSLIELLTTLSIIAIAMVIALPELNIFSGQSTSDRLRSQLLRAIHLARSEAVMQQTNVWVCPSINHQTCVESWQNGFIVASRGQVFYTFQNLAAKGVLHWRAFPLHRALLEFLPQGWPNAENGTFWFCPENRAHAAWAVILNQSGRARTAYPDRQGNIIDANGAVLLC